MNRLGLRIGIATGVAALSVTAAAIAGAPPVNCTGGPCTGTPGSEALIGSELPDQINALAGNDLLEGNGAGDVLRGGKGSDQTNGDEGDDRHIGGPGNDNLSEFGILIRQRGPSETGEDVLRGGKGSDYAEGGLEADTILGGKGNERQVEGPARRGIFGSSSCFRGFCSRLYGDPGNDTINGGKGKDYMEGEEGTDTHIGGPGDDVIDAANDDTKGAKDKVECGPGRDVVFANPPDKVADDCEKVKPPQPVKKP